MSMVVGSLPRHNSEVQRMMERDQSGILVQERGDGMRTSANGAEPSLGELLGRLTSDTGELVRQEVALARAEMKQMGGTLARDGARLGVAFELANAGLLAIAAFLIIVLGNLFGNNYWLSSLIVGVVLLAIGGIMSRNALNDIKQRGMVPEQTLDSLRADQKWASREAQQVKHELTK